VVFDWNPEGSVDSLSPEIARLATDVRRPVEATVCPHPAGPPTCWCRPPLPGLPLMLARADDIDLARSVVVGTRPAHRTLAATLGAEYVDSTS
jgi:histidinol phosphatase-like enzyme